MYDTQDDRYSESTCQLVTFDRFFAKSDIRVTSTKLSSKFEYGVFSYERYLLLVGCS